MKITACVTSHKVDNHFTTSNDNTTKVTLFEETTVFQSDSDCSLELITKSRDKIKFDLNQEYIIEIRKKNES